MSIHKAGQKPRWSVGCYAGDTVFTSPTWYHSEEEARVAFDDPKAWLPPTFPNSFAAILWYQTNNPRSHIALEFKNFSRQAVSS